MKRIAWLSDLHLNVLRTGQQMKQFEVVLAEIKQKKVDYVLIGGDIGEALSIQNYLEGIATKLKRPIYFVLGNHDYYHGSIRDVRAAMQKLTDESRWLKWLPAVGVVNLTPTVALIGHGGWADGRLGDYERSNVMLNDYFLIRELSNIDRAERLHRLNVLGDEAAAYFRETLPEALESCQHIYVLMHVPPFREACWHQGKISDDSFLPHFACQAAGEALREIMQQHPDKQMTVLCGHTHGEGRAQILDNLLVLTSGTDYNVSQIEQLIEIG
jgi:3',5'-cyclic AMP phosphodiesterase CpdA